MFTFGGLLLVLTSLLGNLYNAQSSEQCSKPCIPGSEDIMKPKEHGTSHTPVQENLRWECDEIVADQICNFNRHYAEYSGYWTQTNFPKDIEGKKEITFYDSNTGKPLLTAPKGRTWDAWIEESTKHGWPSFRDNEVNWDNVRVLSNGETVSIDGTHLGHNLPDNFGNRFCLNLVSIAGNPLDTHALSSQFKEVQGDTSQSKKVQGDTSQSKKVQVDKQSLLFFLTVLNFCLS